MLMSASSPSDPNASQRKWLPWVIVIVVVLFLAWWMMGRGNPSETGTVADTTQTMMAPDTTPAPAPEVTPAPAPAQTATPAPATPTDTGHAMTPHTPSRADTIRAPAKPLAPPEPAGPGAMGGRGAPGKKPPAPTP
jgi:hypothetical protein